MARCPIKAASDSDVKAPTEETLGFDDDTLRGEERLIDWNFTKGSTYSSTFLGSPMLLRNYC